VLAFSHSSWEKKYFSLLKISYETRVFIILFLDESEFPQLNYDEEHQSNESELSENGNFTFNIQKCS